MLKIRHKQVISCLLMKIPPQEGSVCNALNEKLKLKWILCEL